MVGGDAVLERVRSAGVLRDIAADRARLLRGRIGSIEEAIVFHRVGDVQVTTPLSTSTRRFGRSIATIRFIRDVQIITGAFTGSAPPERPVPAPRGTKATPRCHSALRTALTCSVVRGITSRSGAFFSIVHPSHS